MPYPTCRHIKEDGYLCKSPALKGQQYCYFHANHRARRMAMAQARARGLQYWLDLPPLEDMQSVVAALDYVAQALHAGVLEPKTAQLILVALRIASMNFRAVKAWNVGSRYENNGQRESVVSYPVQRMHGLPDNLHLDVRPEEAFPMPAVASQSDERAAGGSKSKKPAGSKSNRRPTSAAGARANVGSTQARKPVVIETELGFMDMIREQPDPVEALKDYVRSMFGEPTKTPLFDDLLGIKKPSESVDDLAEEEESAASEAEVGA